VRKKGVLHCWENGLLNKKWLYAVLEDKTFGLKLF